jgi:hypothetical protein
VIDRWISFFTQPSKLSFQRGGGGTGAPQATLFGYFLSITSLSAYTPLATDIFVIGQRIEADMITDFAFGGANAQPITLSFWACPTIAGTFSGAIVNDASTRCYPFTFNIPTANIWTKIAITIPGDTAGTWVPSGNATAMVLRFDLGSGSTLRGPAGAWTSTNYNGVTGAQSIVATNGAQFIFTGVKLEVGSAATPYNHPTMAKALMDCQRYYQQVGYVGIGGGANYAAGAAVFGTFLLPVAMRATPTYTPSASPPVYTNAAGLTALSLGLPQVTFQAAATAANVSTYVTFGYLLSAEL